MQTLLNSADSPEIQFGSNADELQRSSGKEDADEKNFETDQSWSSDTPV